MLKYIIAYADNNMYDANKGVSIIYGRRPFRRIDPKCDLFA